MITALQRRHSSVSGPVLSDCCLFDPKRNSLIVKQTLNPLTKTYITRFTALGSVMWNVHTTSKMSAFNRLACDATGEKERVACMQWTSDEKRLLVKAQLQLGNKWREIQQLYFLNRSQSQVKCMFYRMQRANKKQSSSDQPDFETDKHKQQWCFLIWFYFFNTPVKWALRV